MPTSTDQGPASLAPFFWSAGAFLIAALLAYSTVVLRRLSKITVALPMP